jgi:hypothetical protein
MKRLAFWFAIALLLFVFAFIGLNLFDSGPGSVPGALSPAVAAEDRPLAGNLDPGDGFFLVWGFAEPPMTDPLAPGYRRQVQDLFSARRSSRSLFRSPYGRWLARLNAGSARHWQGANFHIPQHQGEDLSDNFSSRRVELAERQERFAPLLGRYRQLLAAGGLKDFTPLNWECPGRSLQLATQTARLFAASRVLDALDGGWPAAGAELLGAADAGFELIASGRTLAVNSLGKSMIELSLQALSSLLNRPECPREFARIMLDRLPERPLRAFGTGPVRTFHWMSFAASLARVKENRIVDPALLKDYFRDPTAFYAIVGFVGISRMGLFNVAHAVAAFFVKENESVAMLRGFWEKVGALEDTPPWRWGPSYLRLRRSPEIATGPFWWLRNPLGKMMVQSAVPFTWPIIQHYVNRSHEMKARYDLVRLLARMRLAAGAGAGLGETELRRLLAAAAPDPFSGQPFRFNRGRGMLYSVGPDAVDDDGREQAEIWRDSDIAVPIKFVKSEK